MTDAASVGMLAAFAAGIVSFLSPCVLPLVPAYISYVAGGSVHGKKRLHTQERLAALGLAMITGQLSMLAIWLLDAVPSLGRLG